MTASLLHFFTNMLVDTCARILLFLKLMLSKTMVSLSNTLHSILVLIFLHYTHNRREGIGVADITKLKANGYFTVNVGVLHS